MLQQITSRKNPKVVEAASYKNHPGDRFLVEGFHTVEMAIASRLADAVFSLEEYPSKGVPLYLVNQEIIEKLSYTRNPEGIIALCHKPAERRLSSPRALLLDAVQDPGNVGTILRTALSFGFDDVLLGKGTANPYNPKSLLAAQGASFSLNILFGKEADEYADLLRQEGYFLIGTSLQKAVSTTDFAAPEGKLALILGNEGQGVSPKILEKTDINLRIPIRGIDSLNVGVAGGILMSRLALIS